MPLKGLRQLLLQPRLLWPLRNLNLAMQDATILYQACSKLVEGDLETTQKSLYLLCRSRENKFPIIKTSDLIAEVGLVEEMTRARVRQVGHHSQILMERPRKDLKMTMTKKIAIRNGNNILAEHQAKIREPAKRFRPECEQTASFEMDEMELNSSPKTENGTR